MSNIFKNVIVLGANGTIGRTFINQLLKINEIERIYAFSRSKISFESKRIHSYAINYENEKELKNAAIIASKNSSIDLVLVANGILHDQSIFPEKKVGDLSIDKFQKLFLINTILPAIFAKHFLPILNKKTISVFAVMSARVGSISDNRLGGWYSYRASKAALNMIIKNLSIEFERTHKKSIIVGLHPGTVDSPLSKPFQKNIPQTKLFSPDFSIKKLLKIIKEISPNDSGKIFAWDGKEINP